VKVDSKRHQVRKKDAVQERRAREEKNLPLCSTLCSIYKVRHAYGELPNYDHVISWMTTDKRGRRER